jgi:hypothetical protein
MSNARGRSLTISQFFAREVSRLLRQEFDGWHPVAIISPTDLHEAIGGALRGLPQERSRGNADVALPAPDPDASA